MDTVFDIDYCHGRRDNKELRLAFRGDELVLLRAEEFNGRCQDRVVGRVHGVGYAELILVGGAGRERHRCGRLGTLAACVMLTDQ